MPEKRSAAPAPANRNNFSQVRLLLVRSFATLYHQKLQTIQHQSMRRKMLYGVFIAVICCIACAYVISRWYTYSERNQPLVIGTSFVADYASYLGVDPHSTLNAIFSELGVRNIRLVSYWSDIEPRQGHYDFSELDWEFADAAKYHAHVTLAIGMRQPRWPECHVPSWASNESISELQPQLNSFLAAVIHRYRDSPALMSYQLENEYFLTSFGTCTNDSRERLVAETNLVRKLDPTHQLIISRSDNAYGWPINPPHADRYGISIYRRVWSPVIGRYVEYPFPAWYYGFLAGMEKLWSGKDTMIHELQAEPWPSHGKTIRQTSLSEQNKSFDANRLRQTVSFARATGMRTMYLWGAEYWYYRKVQLHDPSVWDTAQTVFAYGP